MGMRVFAADAVKMWRQHRGEWQLGYNGFFFQTFSGAKKEEILQFFLAWDLVRDKSREVGQGLDHLLFSSPDVSCQF